MESVESLKDSTKTLESFAIMRFYGIFAFSGLLHILANVRNDERRGTFSLVIARKSARIFVYFMESVESLKDSTKTLESFAIMRFLLR